MAGFLSKIFGGSKSDKDVKKLYPIVDEVNKFYVQLSTVTNDELRNKTIEFRQRIKEYLADIDVQIAGKKDEADVNTGGELHNREAIYDEVDKLVKRRDEMIEEVLEQIQPEAFAVIKETARRFKENTELVATATPLDRDFAIEKDYVRIDGDKVIFAQYMAGRRQPCNLEYAAL